MPRWASPFLSAVVVAAASIPLPAQDALIRCSVTAEAPILRAEGATELAGSIRLACAGGNPAQVYFINLDLFLNTPITSALTGVETDETEAVLLIDDPRPGVLNTSNGVTYAGQVKGTPGVSPGPAGGPGAPGSGNVYHGYRVPGAANRLLWTNIPFVPAPAGSTRLLRIVNVRADVTRLPAQGSNPAAVTAFLSAAPSQTLLVGVTQFTVGLVLPSLAASVVENQTTLRFEELFAGAFKKRIENTVAGALIPRQQGIPDARYATESGFTPDYGGLSAAAPGAADHGTRLAARITGLPAGVYLIAPNSVLSTRPGGAPGELEARRVINFSSDLAGGFLLSASSPVELAPVAGGEALVVYEVVAREPYDGVTGADLIERFDIPLQVIFAQPVRLGSPSIRVGYAPLASAAAEPRFEDRLTAGPVFSLLAQPALSYVVLRYAFGDPAPVVRNVAVGSENPILEGSITVLPQTGGRWLSAVAADQGETLRLAADPSGLVEGRYLGAVSFRRRNTPLELSVLPVILDVTAAPELAVDKNRLEFEALAGGPAPPSQLLYVTARIRALTFTAAASTSAGGSWLSVSPETGGTPKNLTVSVDVRGLGPGRYDGAIEIAAPGAANSPVKIPVTLVLESAAPFFVPAGVVNAASYQNGAVSPGEIVTIFGRRLGPPETVEGRLARSAAGARFLFDGIAVPIIAVSSGQSTVIAPQRLAGPSVTVEVEFEGARSQPVTLPVVPARPGIFTVDASGRGQGAILNADLTPNSAQNPAPRGSVVAIYFTGAGPARPAALDGAVNTPPDLPVPELPVAVRIGGRAAAVEFVGGAPGAVAGLFQVNARIGPEVAPGPDVPVEVIVAGIASQPGVTLAVR
jgi:uncharacterized protein (TIGR03437 family)